MLNPETRKQLEDMSKGPYAKALKDYLDEEMADIRDVGKIKSWEETLANQKVIKIVDKLFSFMEKRTPQVDKKKSVYR